MKTLKELGAESLITNDRQFHRALHEVCDSVAITEEVALTDGSTFTWEYAEPILLMQLMLDASLELQNRYAETFQLHPGTREQPWSLVFGFDELTPGDFMAANTNKKTMCCYFKFIILGTHTLTQASTWFAPCLIRSETLHVLPGGWSWALGQLLRRMFLGPQGLSTAGAPLFIHQTSHILFADMGVLISDGDGLRMAMCWNGASSIKPCLRHYNVLRKSSDLCGRVHGYAEITCSDPSQFKFSPEKLSEAVDLIAAAHRRLEAGGCSQAFYKRLVKERGFKFAGGGCVFDVELRDRLKLWNAIRIDWVHSALNGGCLSIECNLFIKACSELGLGFDEVEDFFKLRWCFPKSFEHKNKGLHRVFSSWRVGDESNHLKACAS